MANTNFIGLPVATGVAPGVDYVPLAQNTGPGTYVDRRALISLFVTSLGNNGTFTCAAAATTVIANTNVTASSKIFLQATNATAATLMGAATSLYIFALSAGVSFTVKTANAGSAAGSETFNYWILG